MQKDVFDQLLERQGGAWQGVGAVSPGPAPDPDPAVVAAARAVHPALVGLTVEQARDALHLVHRALDLSAVVRDATPAGAKLDRDAQQGVTVIEMGMC